MSAGSMISKLNGRSVTLKRPGAGNTFDASGMAVKAATTDSTITMSIQPISGDELINGVAGQKERNSQKGYTTTEVKASSEEDKTPADIIVDQDSTEYEVQAVEKWVQGTGNMNTFYKVLLIEIDP